MSPNRKSDLENHLREKCDSWLSGSEELASVEDRWSRVKVHRRGGICASKATTPARWQVSVVDEFRRVNAVISESSILHGHQKILGESFMGVLIIRYGFILDFVSSLRFFNVWIGELYTRRKMDVDLLSGSTLLFVLDQKWLFPGFWRG